MPNALEDLIGSREVCQILDIDKSTLSRWVAAGTIVPALKLPTKNGAMLFDPTVVEALRAERSA